MNPTRKMSGAGFAIGLGLMTLGCIVGVDAMQMQVGPAYARVGPQVFPYIIAIGMIATGAVIAWNGWHGKDVAITEEEIGPADWKGVAIIIVGLVAHMNALKPLGFVPAGLILFCCVAFAFGSRKYLRDAVVGVLLALVAYVGFKYGLGLQLPPGILEGIL